MSDDKFNDDELNKPESDVSLPEGGAVPNQPGEKIIVANITAWCSFPPSG